MTIIWNRASLKWHFPKKQHFYTILAEMFPDSLVISWEEIHQNACQEIFAFLFGVNNDQLSCESGWCMNTGILILAGAYILIIFGNYTGYFLHNFWQTHLPYIPMFNSHTSSQTKKNCQNFPSNLQIIISITLHCKYQIQFLFLLY